jgi:hypothetical protein
MAVDAAFRKWATSRGQLLTGTATTRHDAGTWQYVVTLNCTDREAAGRVVPEISQPSVAWDWRAQTLTVLEPGDGWDVTLPALGWDYRVVAPIVGGVAVVGDPALYATAGDMRVHHVADGAVTVVGPNESFEIVSWSEAGGVRRQPVAIGDVGWAEVALR